MYRGQPIHITAKIKNIYRIAKWISSNRSSNVFGTARMFRPTYAIHECFSFWGLSQTSRRGSASAPSSQTQPTYSLFKPFCQILDQPLKYFVLITNMTAIKQSWIPTLIWPLFPQYCIQEDISFWCTAFLQHN